MAIDWDRRFAWVEPSEGEGRSRWLGTGQPLSAELCGSIRDVLAGADPPGVTLTTRASDTLDEVRSSFHWVRSGRMAVVASDQGLDWWTFAGLHANAALMVGMGPLLGGTKVDNLAIKLDPTYASARAVRPVVDSIDAAALPAPWIAETIAQRLIFSDCLPGDIALPIASARIIDTLGVERVASDSIDDVDAADVTD